MSGISILSATYGVGSTTVDVTSNVTSQIKNGEVKMSVSPQGLNVDDPAPGQNKTLNVKFTINNGNTNLVTLRDGELLDIAAQSANLTDGLQILKAEYGYTGNWTDVTYAVQNQVSNGSIKLKVGFKAVGIPDPNPSKKKTLKVEYTLNGSKNAKEYGDDSTFELSAPPDVNGSSSNKTPKKRLTDSISIITSGAGNFFYYLMQFISAFALGRVFSDRFKITWYIFFAIGLFFPHSFFTMPFFIGMICFFRPQFLGNITMDEIKQSMLSKNI